MTLDGTFHKAEDPDTKAQHRFKSIGANPVIIQNIADIEQVFESECANIKRLIDEFNKKSSNWILETVNELSFSTHQVDLNKGGAGAVVLPKCIKNSRCVINLEACPDNDCFMYAALAAIHYQDVAPNGDGHPYV